MLREPQQCGMINFTEITIRQGAKGPLTAAGWKLRGLGAAGAERALCPCQLAFRTAWA
jgi:hypothetical protein